MSRPVNRIIPLFFLSLAAGCGFPVAYTPNRPPVPLITHQGELDLTGGVTFPNASGFNYEAVYAPINHISAYAAFQFDRHTGGTYMSGPEADYSDYNNHFFEIGFGYFDSISWAHYEAYLHVGFGTGEDHQTDWSSYQTDTTTLNAFRIGIQQNVGIKDEGHSLGAGLGLGYEHLSKVLRNVTNYDKPELEYSDSAIAVSSVLGTSPQSAFYAEPTAFCSIEAPLSFDGTQLFVLRFIAEIWVIFRTNPYPAFGGGNAALAVGLDF